eukprot:TRINITY_DN47691_c0_g1_i1.p1 TRINITY_DN47691_c0_g1~~TRINITY_DN47691_c0_g1_i1.p1  ORF type:complete len:130 (+),score=40.68 TRINITY_DN47691_c0_g1_i1:56-391(+)
MAAGRSGWMTKQGGGLGSAKRRFFVLDGAHLRWYEDDTRKKEIRALDLREVEVELEAQHSRLALTGKYFEKKGKQYVLTAPDEQSARDWAKAISRAGAASEGASAAAPPAS